MKLKLNQNQNLRKLITTFLFFSIIIFYTPSIFAQNENEELKINIQLRPRAEFRNGLFTPILEGQKPATFVAQRSRIGLTYSKNKKLIIGLSTQVVTTWGNDPQVQTTSNDISLYEAWAKLYFNSEWNIKVGRQILSYDDERILGALDWNNAGRKHDAALLEFEKSKFKANAAFAFNQNAEKVTNTFYDNSLSQPYKAMEFLWMKYKFTDAFSISALAMNLGIQNRIDSSVSNLQTLGGNIYYKKNKWNISGTYYYQTGRNPLKNSSSIKTSAWMASAKADYSFNKWFNLGIGSDYLSGRDMNSTSSNISYFNPLYGTGHKFYGAMDYFYVSSAHDNVGLWDSYVNVNLNAAEKLSWQIALHHFESAARIINYSGAETASALGNEADVAFNYKVMNDVKLSGGYSQMFTDPSMKYVKNILPNQSMKSLQNWVWLSININPDILIYKSK
ncbi:MAG TPA: alginate export family protein [Hanamia sp.]|nr:alginate export family protein [Hanamia sp.]